MDEKGYTEYGYRGLEELQAKDKEIAKLKEEISKLKMQLQGMENRCNDLQAKASIPRY
jgi:predicted  nucleic acid-binding Zn-ribbon protein